MLETGQPLHAFDLDKVRGNQIIVRRAREGEKITTLDDVERKLDPSIAVVGDAEGPSGIAGIMGGQISEVSDTTTRVLMEAATWVAPNIMRSQAKLGLRSEASTRFEKGLHPDNALAGQRLAARLMVELAGARFVPGTIDVYPRPVDPRVVTLRYPRIEKLLGVEVDARARRRDPHAARLRRPRRHAAAVRGDDPLLARRRRPARGRPDRGGRAHLRARQDPGDAARARRRRRSSEPVADAAPAARGRAARARARRDRRLVVHVAADVRAAAAHRRPAAAGRQRAVRGPVRDAAAAAARAARRGRAQRRPRAQRAAAVRVRARLPRRWPHRPPTRSTTPRSARAARRRRTSATTSAR